MEILETVLSVCTSLNIPPGGIEILTGLAKRFLMAQKELGLHYLPEFYLVSLSMSVTLTRVGFEHEQLSILKLLTFLVKWKTETGMYLYFSWQCSDISVIVFTALIRSLACWSHSKYDTSIFEVIQVNLLKDLFLSIVHAY